MKKIIFLDMDGPVIPTPMFSISGDCSIGRTALSTVAIGWLLWLHKFTGALIVTNSAHNYHNVADMDHRSLRADLITHGLPLEMFHDDWRTGYPNRISRGGPRRIAAVTEWLAKNREYDEEGRPLDVNWVAFDDDLHGYGYGANDAWHPRLVPIDFHVGIDVKSVRHALTILDMPIPHHIS